MQKAINFPFCTNIHPETQPELRNAEFGGYPPNSYKSTYALNPCRNTYKRQQKPSLAGTRQTRANRFLHEYYAGNTANKGPLFVPRDSFNKLA